MVAPFTILFGILWWSCLFSGTAISNNFPPTQLQALHDLYLHTNGAYWTWQSNVGMWNFDEVDPNPCLESWQGIGCSSDCMGGSSCTVRNLTLSNYNLTGSLPATIGNLSGLISLDLSINHLRGGLRNQIGKLTLLETLDLTSNMNLRGTIPSSLGSCTKLVNLHLSITYMVGKIPSSLGNLLLLEDLRLGDNYLTGTLPSNFNKLKKLKIFDLERNGQLVGRAFNLLLQLPNLVEVALSDNAFVGSIPATIDTLKSLRVLVLFNNRFSGELPSTIGNLHNLNILQLGNNFFVGLIPPTIGNLTNLEILYLNENFFSGALPLAFPNLQKLKILHIYNNFFTGTIPEVYTTFPEIEVLDLSINYLNGTIPSSIGSLTTLTNLELDLNELTGAIPDSIGNLRQLRSLSIIQNNLNTTIPESIGQLEHLFGIYLQNNYLRGTIPATIGNMKNLTFIVLFNNELTGSVPSNITQLQHLVKLSLTSNLFTGTIPPEIFNPPRRLKALQIYRNYFSGTIPNEIGNSTSLFNLDGGFNMFTGTIPRSVGNCIAMTDFAVPGNYLTGSIPEEIGNLSSMSYLYLFNNLFTGTLAASLGNLLTMADFEVEFNALTGSIPPSLGSLQALVYLGINYNFFTSSLPQSLENLRSMVVFTAESNYYSGTLPAGIFTNWQALEVLTVQENFISGVLDGIVLWNTLTDLNVSSNFFSGSLSTLQINLPLLQSIDLSFNYLTGTIDNVFDNATSLQYLNLARNQFTGNLNFAFASQQQLQLIDVSDNQFTGTLPATVFQLPTLQTFAAVKNCFTGSLPTNSICASTNLTTLALDGLHTAEACQDRFFPGWHSITSYQLESSLEGGLAGCLFNMSGLKTLHLSGNGITGTIPSMRSEDVGSRLSDVSLSYNQLTGSIPSWMQERRWKNLDVSFNKLNGVLESGFAAAVNGSTLKMTVNRLSGEIPSSLLEAEDIDMLQGNIFRCDKSETLGGSSRSLPSHDDESTTYECGSDSVDTAMYVWISLSMFLFLIFVVFIVLVRKFNWFASNNDESEGNESSSTSLVLLRICRKELLECYQFYYSEEVNNEELRTTSEDSVIAPERGKFPFRSFGYSLMMIRSMSLLITIYAVCLLLPLYALLANYYGTHTYTYIWSIALAYLTGMVPAVIIFAFMVVFYALIGGKLVQYLFRFEHFADAPDERHSEAQRHSIVFTSMVQQIMQFCDWKPVQWRPLLWHTVVGMINISVVLMVNILYVYITTLSLGVTAMFFIEILISLFKILWGSIVVLEIIAKTVHFADDHEHNPIHKVCYLVQLILFNNIIAPFLAAAFVDPNCFLFMITAQDPVTVSYEKETCYIYDYTTDNDGTVHEFCFRNEFETSFSTYDPPFVYSYQCSSALLSGFVNIFIYRYLITGILVPIGNLLLHSYQEKYGALQGWDINKLFFGYMLNEQPIPLQEHELRSFARKTVTNHNVEDSAPDQTTTNPIQQQTATIISDEPTIMTKSNTSPRLKSVDPGNTVDTTLQIISPSNNNNKNINNNSIERVTIFKKVSCIVTLVGDLAVSLTFGIAFPPLSVIITTSIITNTWYIQWQLSKIIRALRNALQSPTYSRQDSTTLARYLQRSQSKIGISTSSLDARKLLDSIQDDCSDLLALFWPTIPSLAILSSIFIAIFLFDILGDQVGVLHALWILLVMSTMPLWIWIIECLYEFSFQRCATTVVL